MTNKENLVMIHGLLGSLSFFKPENYLAEINIFTPDMYCYGDSACLEKLSLKNQADYIEELITAEIQKPVWLLGHSVGGAVATILASKNPKIVKGIINVEGNFTLNDAFWCQKISEMDFNAWEEEYSEISRNPKNWLRKSNIAITSETEAWAREILNYQTALSAQKVAKAVVSETGSVDYEEKLQSVIINKIPIHLIAGESSKDGWDVPESYYEAASSLTVISNTGHMMMLENPKEFCDIIKNIVWAQRST